MSNSFIEKSFCTTREAAELLGVSVGTVQLWVEAGLLQAWKTAGGHRRVMRDSVDRLIRKTPATQVTPPASDTGQAQSRELNVMVVEDDEDLLRLYGVQIANWPMPTKVLTLNNAFTALLQMGRGGPDLLIADLHMPGMDGFSMLNVLQKAPEMANTTIVVVSGLDAASISHRGGVPAGIEVLKKPVPFDRLKAIATGICNQPRFQLAAA